MDPKNISRNWDRYSEYVIRTLDEFREHHKEIQRGLDALCDDIALIRQQDATDKEVTRGELKLLRFKAGLIMGVIGSVAGAVVSALVSSVVYYFMSHPK